jgi:hypothetical protein
MHHAAYAASLAGSTNREEEVEGPLIYAEK